MGMKLLIVCLFAMFALAFGKSLELKATCETEHKYNFQTTDLTASDDESKKMSYPDCTSGLFTIESTSYGNVYYYGVVGKYNILQFTKKSKSYFCFTSNKALKEVKSGKCIRGLSIESPNRQLVLTDKCDKTWTYSPAKKQLVYVESGKCLSPWNYDYAKLTGVGFVPGLSTCSTWNKISLNECASDKFTIESTSYGRVYYYGVVGKLNILQFTKKSKSYFCFTCNKALKEVKSGKCIRGLPIDSANRQLVLTDKCDKTWTYSPAKKQLVYVESGKCLSPWNYDNAKLTGVRFVPGLSTCSTWNKISLNGLKKNKVSC